MNNNKKKYIYLYKTINIINNKYYIGIHGTNNINDNYLGSGVYLKIAIKKYGIKNFKKEILEFFDTYREANKREKSVVNKNFIKNRNTYNSELGGRGGKIWSIEMKKQMSESKKGNIPWNKGLTQETDERVKKYVNTQKGQIRKNISGNKNPMFGIDVATLMTPEKNKIRLQKISIANMNKKRTKEHKKHYSNYAKKRFWIVNQYNEIKHCLSKDDYRLKNKEFKLGKIW